MTSFFNLMRLQVSQQNSKTSNIYIYKIYETTFFASVKSFKESNLPTTDRSFVVNQQIFNQNNSGWVYKKHLPLNICIILYICSSSFIDYGIEVQKINSFTLSGE